MANLTYMPHKGVRKSVILLGLGGMEKACHVSIYIVQRHPHK